MKTSDCRESDTDKYKQPIGFVYLTCEGQPPYTSGWPVDNRYFGVMRSEQRAPENCPRIYFKLPITQPVTAVLWNMKLGNGNFLTQSLPFPWKKYGLFPPIHISTRGVSFQEPGYLMRMTDPPRELALHLEYATELWRPFTSLVSAWKLLPGLSKMLPPELDDFMERLGRSQNRGKLETLHQKAFIANCWIPWEQAELRHKDRVRDMERNGVPIELENFKKLAKREMQLRRHFLK